MKIHRIPSPVAGWRYRRTLNHLLRGALDRYHESLVAAARHYQSWNPEYHLRYLFELANFLIVSGDCRRARTILAATNPQEAKWHVSSDEALRFLHDCWRELAVRLQIWQGDNPSIRSSPYSATQSLLEARQGSTGVVLTFAENRLAREQVVPRSIRWPDPMHCWLAGGLFDHDLICLTVAFAADDVGDQKGVQATLDRLRLPITLWSSLGQEWPAMGRFIREHQRTGLPIGPISTLDESTRGPRSAAVGGAKLLHRG